MRKKRLELNSTQSEAAAAMGVDEMTVVGWELNRHKPLTRHIPKIIKFLGYVPKDLFPAKTIGQKIRRYRLLEGMTRIQLAGQLQIDATTLERLEMDKQRKSKETASKVSEFLKSLT